MAQINFGLCETEEDFQAAYSLFQLNWTENGYTPPIEQAFRNRFEANELAIGKTNQGEVVAFFQWHKDDDYEPGLGRYLIIYVAEAYRTAGIAKDLLDYGRTIMQSRGITYLEVWSFPRPDVQATVASRGLILDRTETIDGIDYEVYRMAY